MTKKPPAHGQQTKADWEVVEKEYRAGVLSLRAMAERHGVSEAAIRKHAKAKHWTRNLQEKIQARAQDLVDKQQAIDARALDYQSPKANLDSVREHEVVEIAARNVAVVRLSHREKAGRLMAITYRMLDELEKYGDEGKAVLQLATKALAAKKDGMDAATLRKLQGILSLGNRAEILKKLSDTMRTAFTLEREAFGMAAIPLGPDGNPKEGDDEDMRDRPIRVSIQTEDASRPEADFEEGNP